MLQTWFLLFFQASFLQGLWVRKMIEWNQLQVGSTVDGQPYIPMDIDSWTKCEMRPHSDLGKSYSSGGQPPSIGDVRRLVVSEASDSSQIYSDGQPPSVNDVGRREPSQSDEHEVEQVISETNDGVYKRGAVRRSIDINAYPGYDVVEQDLVSTFGSKASKSTDSTINDGGFLNGGVWAQPPPQPFLRIGTFVMVYKSGAIARSIDISAYSGYDELKQDLARIFSIEGQLDDPHRVGWKLLFVDGDEDVLFIGDEPNWQKFVDCIGCIKILSPQEVQQMRLDGYLGGNNVHPNKACNTLAGENFKFTDHIHNYVNLYFRESPLGRPVFPFSKS